MYLEINPITQKGEAGDIDLRDEIIGLYASEPDLRLLPQLLFGAIGRLVDADVVTFGEFHQGSGGFRSLLSVDDDLTKRSEAIVAFARHMHSHPFWHHDPKFFGERALRESDVFSETEYLNLPIVKEALLPSGARYLMAIVIAHDSYVVALTAHRTVARSGFTDAERDRMEGFRPHILRCYRQALERVVAKLTPTDRLRMAFPGLTARQLDVATWLARGKANEDIADILGLGIDTVKAHVKALYRKIGSESRLAAAVVAHTALPFSDMPPLWTLEPEAWGNFSSPTR